MFIIFVLGIFIGAVGTLGILLFAWLNGYFELIRDDKLKYSMRQYLSNSKAGRLIRERRKMK